MNFSDDHEITLDILENFSQTHSLKARNNLLSVLGKGSIFIEALQTEVGKEILTETIDRLMWLFDRIADDVDCPDQLKIEYKMLRGICRIWSAKIMQYKNARQTLIKAK